MGKLGAQALARAFRIGGGPVLPFPLNLVEGHRVTDVVRIPCTFFCKPSLYFSQGPPSQNLL